MKPQSRLPGNFTSDQIDLQLKWERQIRVLVILRGRLIITDAQITPPAKIEKSEHRDGLAAWAGAHRICDLALYFPRGYQLGPPQPQTHRLPFDFDSNNC
jgi:hypothetical protein